MKRNRLILLLVAITFIIVGCPLFLYGIGGAFYRTFDPDIVYITNALSYTKYGIIYYADHPGTPTIMTLYYLYFPLRLLAKYVWHIGFLDWSFNNYAVLNYYTRAFELILTAISLFIFLKTISKNLRSKLDILIAWFAMFSFGGLGFAISVAPENLSVFLTSIWICLFTSFQRKKSYLINIILVVISGLAVANKFTALFLLIASIFLPFFIARLKFCQKIVRLLANISFAVASFYLGILPAMNRFTYIKNWAIGLFYHTGNHATGAETIFDPRVYFESLSLLIKEMPFAFVFALIIFVLAIFLIIKRKLKISDPYIFLLSTSLMGILVFAKYPITHYNLVNFLLIIFCGSYFLSKVDPKFKLYLLILLLAPFIMSLNVFVRVGRNQFQQDAELLNYISSHPPQQNILWGRDNMYQTLESWTRYWTSDLFRDQFDKKPVMIISNDLKTVSVSVKDAKIIKKPFEVCWDKAYLPKEEALKFADFYNDKALQLKPVKASAGFYEITSSHCTKTIKLETP